MKKIKPIKGILAGVFYFALFSVVQTVVAIVYMAGLLIFEIIHNNLSFESVDENYFDTILLSQENLSLCLIIASIVYICIIYLIFKIKKKNMFEEVGLRKIPLKSILPMIFFGMSFNFTSVFIFFELIPFPETWYDSFNEATAISGAANLWLELIAGVIMAGFVEEICFRGLVYSRFKSAMPVYMAIIASAILFGHGHPTPIWFLYTALSSIITIYFFEKFKSVTICVAEHMSFNFSAWFMQYVIGNNANWLEPYQLYIYIVMSAVSIISFVYIAKLKILTEPEVTNDL